MKIRKDEEGKCDNKEKNNEVIYYYAGIDYFVSFVEVIR